MRSCGGKLQRRGKEKEFERGGEGEGCVAGGGGGPEDFGSFDAGGL